MTFLNFKTLGIASVLLYALLGSNTSIKKNSLAANSGYTGEIPQFLCTQCHTGSNNLNNNGSVTTTLPSTFKPNTTYNFTINVNCNFTNRKRFGFAIKAVSNDDGFPSGIWTAGLGSGAIVNSSSLIYEMGHYQAGSVNQNVNDYTFYYLRYTTPAVIPAGGIKFYLTGLAGDYNVGGNGQLGDYVYTTNFTIFQENLTTLPVVWSNFKLIPQTNGVLLKWQTTQERNNTGFEIEKRTDGKTFKLLTSVKSKAQSKETNQYQFLDETKDKGIVYYRIKQIDLDGKTSYSNVLASRFNDKSSDLMAYPNPNHGQFTVLNAGKNNPIEIFTASGQLINTRTDQNSNVNIENLPKGVYILKAPNKTPFKVIKQ